MSAPRRPLWLLALALVCTCAGDPISLAPYPCTRDFSCPVGNLSVPDPEHALRCLSGLCQPRCDLGCPSGEACGPGSYCAYVCDAGNPCPVGVCANGVCVDGVNCAQKSDCATGRSCCAGKCIDTTSDKANCGACGSVCGSANATPTCKAGKCVLACKTGFSDCDAKPANGCEVDTTHDPNNCTACGMACPSVPNATAACFNSGCGVGPCDPGFADCNMDSTDGCERSVASDTENCGGCGTVCSMTNTTSTCVMGKCVISACSPGFSDCDKNTINGCEAAVATDPQNCGACGNACGGQFSTCANGSCACMIGNCQCQGQSQCTPGLCYDLTSDPHNCGQCRNDCNGQKCVNSQCQVDVGCADGNRDGYTVPQLFPNIAACAGGWSVPGLMNLNPACARMGGNDGPNPSGNGCSAADLCSDGWHVCASGTEVSQKSPTGCQGAAVAPGLFFAAAQGGPGACVCSVGGTDDIFGCGTIGATPGQACGTPLQNSNCGALDRWSQNLCMALGAPWSCGNDKANEVGNVTKSGPGGGGVLCCRN